MNETLRRQVLDMMNRHDVGLFEYEGPDGSLKLDAERELQDHSDMLAPAPGLFLWKHPTERAEPTWPRQVKQGDVIGWLKVGPLLRPILAKADGILRRPRVAHGSLAGYGDQLF